jgi:prefoldin subunit 5
VKATSAAAAEKKLADSMKTLQGQQAAATSEIKKANAPVDKMKNALDGLGFGDKAEKLKKLTAGIGGMHVAALLTAAAFAVVAIGIGAAIFSAAKFAVASNPEAVQRLTAASAKLQASFAKLFSGLKLDKFISALEDVMSIFDEGTSSAGAMKVLIEGLLQPIFDGAAKAGPFVKEMFKGMVYGALQVAIFVLKARNAFLAMLPESVRTAIQNFTKDNVHDAERVHDSAPSSWRARDRRRRADRRAHRDGGRRARGAVADPAHRRGHRAGHRRDRLLGRHRRLDLGRLGRLRRRRLGRTRSTTSSTASSTASKTAPARSGRR